MLVVLGRASLLSIFFFNDTATTEIYTLSLHDALPISSAASPESWNTQSPRRIRHQGAARAHRRLRSPPCAGGDRKSTRLNSSHDQISYAVFCLKKKIWCCGYCQGVVVDGLLHRGWVCR